MFLGNKEQALDVLRAMGERLCVYAGAPWPRYCDCKYGGPNPDCPGNEDSGCPELASIYAVVSLMTDLEWADIAKRGGHALTDTVIDTVLDEMNKTLSCQCAGVPPMQPCGPVCKYSYTDEKIRGREGC